MLNRNESRVYTLSAPEGPLMYEIIMSKGRWDFLMCRQTDHKFSQQRGSKDLSIQDSREFNVRVNLTGKQRYISQKAGGEHVRNVALIYV